jgi:hypothetical protein
MNQIDIFFDNISKKLLTMFYSFKFIKFRALKSFNYTFCYYSVFENMFFEIRFTKWANNKLKFAIVLEKHVVIIRKGYSRLKCLSYFQIFFYEFKFSKIIKLKINTISFKIFVINYKCILDH